MLNLRPPLPATQRFGLGKHVQRADPAGFKGLWQVDYAIGILYPVTITLIKISILFFQYRIFHVANFKRLALGTGALVVVWGLSIVSWYRMFGITPYTM